MNTLQVLFLLLAITERLGASSVTRKLLVKDHEDKQPPRVNRSPAEAQSTVVLHSGYRAKIDPQSLLQHNDHLTPAEAQAFSAALAAQNHDHDHSQGHGHGVSQAHGQAHSIVQTHGHGQSHTLSQAHSIDHAHNLAQAHSLAQAHQIHGLAQAHHVHGLAQTPQIHGLVQAHHVHGLAQTPQIHGLVQAPQIHGLAHAHSHGLAQAHGHEALFSPSHGYYDLSKVFTIKKQPYAVYAAKAKPVAYKIEQPLNFVYTAPKPTAAAIVAAPVAFATAAYTGSEDHHETHTDSYASKYKFGYRVSDPHTGAEFGHSEVSEGHVTKGHYHVLLPDGRIQNVKYWADPSGYHATVSYEGHKLPQTN